MKRLVEVKSSAGETGQKTTKAVHRLLKVHKMPVTNKKTIKQAFCCWSY